MYFVKLLLFFVIVTTIGLLITRQQIAETLLLYQIHDQERLARRLDDEHQLLNYQVNALASPKRLTSALARQSLSLDHSPVAVVQLGTAEGKAFQLAEGRQGLPWRLAKSGQGLLERLSLIRAAEARSR